MSHLRRRRRDPRRAWDATASACAGDAPGGRWESLASRPSQTSRFVRRSRRPGAGAYDEPVAHDAEAALVAGRAALESGKWSAARSAFETAVEQAPTAEALLGLGEAVWWLETSP